MPTSTEKNRKALAKDFQAIIKDSQALLDSLSGELDDKAKQARAKLEGSLESAKSGLEALEDRAVDELRHTDELVRSYPYHTAGIALGLGFLVGLLTGRPRG